MKHNGYALALAALVLSAFALRGSASPEDEAQKLMAQARALDAQAEKLLDEGKRPAAFEALARAADLRARARRIRAGETKAPAPPPAPAARDAAGAALAAMEDALKKDDLPSAATEGRRAFEALSRWAAALEGTPQADLARRIEGIEAQVRELRMRLEPRER